ncbi:unnamed protein product [Rhizopus microsporus]|nr:hypothetical protein BCV71DRAFT_225042 [Rhizopus microsporus]
MDEAKRMQMKSYYTYKKAYDALCRYPNTFEHPSQAQRLEGIGQIMAKRLTEKMIEYCQNNDLPVPLPVKGKRKRGEQDDSTEQSSSQSSRSRAPKTYVPTFRSGSYAILLCLLDFQQNGQTSATKEQICSYGQKYCDNSMTLADPGKSYTAFSGVKTLIDKGYVYKNGRPPKYMLTETGIAMAEKLRDVNGEGHNDSSQTVREEEHALDINDTGSRKQPRKKKKTSTADILDRLLESGYGISDEPDLSLYTLDPSKHHSISLNGRTVTRDTTTLSNTGSLDNTGDANTLKEQKDVLKKPSKNRNYSNTALDISAGSTGLTRSHSIMSIDDDSEIELCDDILKDSQDSVKSKARPNNIDDTFYFTYLDVSNTPVKYASSAAVDIDELNSCLVYKIRFYSRQRHHPQAERLVKVTEDEEVAGTCIGFLPELYTESECVGLPMSVDENDLEADDDEPVNRPDTPSFSQQTYESQVYSQQATSSQQQRKKDIQAEIRQYVQTEYTEPILPEEYDIILVLDNREVQMKNNRSYFQEKLIEKGISICTRSLDLGDFIWIARKRGSADPSDELFLDYIVERKRLDDLVHSLKDGRYKEQKARLKRSGAQQVIYIVEEYNREYAVNFGLQAIQTIMSSIQVVDGFFLKRTNTIDETIDYLVSLTRLIERIYKGTTLYPIPGHIVTSQNYIDLKRAYKDKVGNSKTAYLISYPVYNQINSKNGSTSLHEIYLRMLTCIRGVNAEKALALMRVYPTPYSLLSAFQNKDEHDAKNLAYEATQTQINRRKWGPQLSERLYQVWGASEYSNTEALSD